MQPKPKYTPTAVHIAFFSVYNSYTTSISSQTLHNIHQYAQHITKIWDTKIQRATSDNKKKIKHWKKQRFEFRPIRLRHKGRCSKYTIHSMRAPHTRTQHILYVYGLTECEQDRPGPNTVAWHTIFYGPAGQASYMCMSRQTNPLTKGRIEKDERCTCVVYIYNTYTFAVVFFRFLSLLLFFCWMCVRHRRVRHRLLASIYMNTWTTCTENVVVNFYCLLMYYILIQFYFNVVRIF